MTRNEARISGLKLYYTGKPCRRGHDAYRYTTSGTCTQCVVKQPVGLPATVIVLKRVFVPRKHLQAIVEIINAYMDLEGITTRQTSPAFKPEQFLPHSQIPSTL
jgi:hypothetical protein